MNQYNSTMYNQTIYIGNSGATGSNSAGLVPVTSGITPNSVAPQQQQVASIPGAHPAQPVMISAANPYGMMYPNMGVMPMATPNGVQPMMMGMNPMLQQQQQYQTLLMQQQLQQQRAMEMAGLGYANPQLAGMIGMPGAINPANHMASMNPMMMMQSQQQAQLQLQQQNQMKLFALQMIASNPQTKKLYESIDKVQQEQMLSGCLEMMTNMPNQDEEDEEEYEEDTPQNMFPFAQMMQGQAGGMGYYQQPQDDEDDEEDEDQNQQEMMLNMMQQFFKKAISPEKEVFEQLDSQLADEEEIDKKLRDRTQIAECSNCNCCKGYPYNCQGSICQELGTCHCYMHNEKEAERKIVNKYFRERESCQCCRGYVYGCKGATCNQNGFCFCSSG